MNVLYYSTRCPHCARLFSEYNLETQASNNAKLKLVNLDAVNVETLPTYLRVVPTLVLSGTNERYEGKDVFSALRSRLAPVQRALPPQQQQQQEQQQANPVVEPYAFSCNNVANKGFSFINTDHPVYSEQANYAFFT